MTDEELRLKIKAAQGGDLESRNAVIVAARGFVRTIVSRYAAMVGREDLIEDMCQEAIFGTSSSRGLVRAIERYKTEGKEAFSTFAGKYVLGVAREMVLPSMLTRRQVSRRNEVRRKMGDQSLVGHSALRAAVAEGSVAEVSVSTMRERRQHDDTPHDFNEDHDIVLSITGNNFPEMEMVDMIHGDERRARFMAALENLTLTERFVVTAIAGLNGAPVTAAKLAKKMGTSRFAVGRLLKRAVQKIKEDPICRLE